MRGLATFICMLLLASPAVAQEATAVPTLDPALGRMLERDPGIKCREAVNAHKYEDAEDYCRQAATLDAAYIATKKPSDDMYPMALSNEAWDQYDAAFSILTLMFQGGTKSAASSHNYNYALTFLVPCSKNAAKAIDAAKTEEQKSRLGTNAAQVKHFCDTLANAIRKNI